ncbi:MAG: response regulator [Proteobacteria bacterium]|nr:response regulator [Pseudomonadota bacterium]
MAHGSGTIFLVEDSPEDFEATRRAFKKIGLQNPLVHVSSGEAALEYLRANPRPSLILLDLNMPGIGGHEVLKIIKQDEKLREIPVVMLTSSKSKLAIQLCYQLGANAYILKSADFEVLAANIKRLKEHWLDTVELPQIFDEDHPRSTASFSVLEEKDLPESLHRASPEVYLLPREVYHKIMGPGPHKPLSETPPLTPPEIETLTWIARGKSRWETGVILGVSEDAVKARLEKSRQKLGATNTTHAIAIALLHGLLLT